MNGAMFWTTVESLTGFHALYRAFDFDRSAYINETGISRSTFYRSQRTFVVVFGDRPQSFDLDAADLIALAAQRVRDGVVLAVAPDLRASREYA